MWSKLGALFFGSLLVIGCAQKNVSTPRSETASLRPVAESTLAENDPGAGNKLVRKAKSAIGTPYVLGGSAPGGFDCSGLVQWTYNSVGVSLPRTAREQASVGQKVKNVKDMRAGDIVAFRHPRRGYHTGIYVGDGKFVHSPRKRSTVRINSLSDAYFRDTLLGARRVNLSGSENLLAHADGRLEEFVAEKSRMRLSARNLEKIRAASKKAPADSAKTVAANKNVKQTRATPSNKKSVIAQQARKITSVKTLTGKSSNKNGSTHAKLASASKKTTKLSAASAAKAANSKKATKSVSANTTKAANNSKKTTKTVSMLSVKPGKQAAKARRR